MSSNSQSSSNVTITLIQRIIQSVYAYRYWHISKASPNQLTLAHKPAARPEIGLAELQITINEAKHSKTIEITEVSDDWMILGIKDHQPSD